MRAALVCLLLALSLAGAEPDQRQGRIFWSAVTDIATGRCDQAIAALRQLQQEARGTSVATRAQALIGCALERQGRNAEAYEAYRAARHMDGCDYRDCAWSRAWELEEALWPLPSSSEAPIAAWLAATAPRPGLSRAEDVERQNRRARALLAGPHDSGLADRLRAECADAEILPAVLLVLATPDDPWAGPRPDDQLAPPWDLVLLKQVAEAYPRSLIGQTAAVRLFGRSSDAWVVPADDGSPTQPSDPGLMAWLQRFPAYDPEHEPLPAAVTWYRAQDGYASSTGTVAETAERWRPESATELLRQGQTAAYLRLVEKFPDLQSEPETRLARTQPEVARLYVQAMSGDAAACRALAKSDAGPELAQAALRRLADLVRPPDPVWRELAERYPASGAGLWAASRLAANAGDLTKARALAEQAARKPLPWDDPDWWRGRATSELDHEERRASVVRDCLPLLPSLTSAQAAATIDRALGSHDPAAWEPLVKAAGPRWSALLPRLRLAEEGYQLPTVVPRVGLPPLVFAPLGLGACECCSGTSVTLEQVMVAYNAGIAESEWPLRKVLSDLNRDASDRQLAECRLLAKRYADTPAADLLRVRYGRTLYDSGWYGESEAMVQPVAAGQGPRRSVAMAILAAARERLAVLRQPGWPQVWRAKLTAPGRPAIRGFERAVMGADRVYALARAEGGEWLVLALDRADGHELWHVGLPVGRADLMPYTRHGEPSLMLVDGALVVSWWERSLTLALADGHTLRNGQRAPAASRTQPKSFAVAMPDGRGLVAVVSADGPSVWYSDQHFLLRYSATASRPVPVCVLPEQVLAADHHGMVCGRWDRGLVYLAAPTGPPRR